MAGAETLLESHQEHHSEIEARKDSFAQTFDSGRRLLTDNINEINEIQECLDYLAGEKDSLDNLWEERRILYEQCMDLQLFYRF